MSETELERLEAYFESKLRGEKQVAEVIDSVREEDRDLVLVDVRDAADYREGHIKGAISMPVEEIDRRYKEIPSNKEIVTYCYSQTCHLSTQAALKLVKHGIAARELNVGWKEWVNAGYPISSSHSS